MSKITCRNCGLKQRNILKLTRLNNCRNCDVKTMSDKKNKLFKTTSKKWDAKVKKNKPCRLCKNSKGQNITHRNKCPKLSSWGKVGNMKQFNTFRMNWLSAPKAVKQAMIKPSVLPAHIMAHLAQLGYTDITTVEEMNKALQVGKGDKEVI